MQFKTNGKQLCKIYGLTASHSLYREDGKWYHILKKFPGILFDRNGFVLFESREEFLDCEALKASPETDQLHVADGISTIPGYTTFASLADSENYETDEDRPLLPSPRFVPSAAVAFTIMGHLLQRVRRPHEFSMRMTHTCHYECLSLFTDRGRRQLCALNFLSGRLHVCAPLEDADTSAIEKWPESRNYLLASLSNEYSAEELAVNILTAIGVPKNDKPTPRTGCMALAIGAAIVRFMFDREPVLVENAWANKQAWTPWLESVPEDCMLSRPFQNEVVGRLWRLQFKNRSVLFDDGIVYLMGVNQAINIRSEATEDGGSMATIAARIEEHLRG